MTLELTLEEQQIVQHYDKIPYHNFEHATHATENVMFIANKLKDILSLTEDDIDTVRKAALWQDAGYGKNHEELLFKTKEDYSIYLMKQFYKNSLPKEKIHQIASVIEATKINFTSFTNHLQKILRAADIRNLGGDYDTFENGTRKIKDEYEFLHNTKLDATIYLKKQIEILSIFLQQKNLVKELYFQKEHFDFYKTFAENIEKLEKKFYDINFILIKLYINLNSF